MIEPPLLPNHEWFFEMFPHERWRMVKARFRCRLNGHMWLLGAYDPRTGEALLECFRCFPHRDSHRRVVSYDPFSTSRRVHT